MSDTNLPGYDLSLICHLCGRSVPAAQMGMRGRLNFCQTCASERPAECLERLQGVTPKSVSPASFALVGLLIALGIGFAGWKLANPSPRAEPVAEPVAVEEVIPLQVVDEGAPVAAKISPPAASESTLERPAATVAPRATPDPRERSVEDAGHLHLLFVTRTAIGLRVGLSSQLFMTREAPHETSARLVTEVGRQMATSFDEGLRYVRKQPRAWEREFSVRLSFEDKFTSKDGGSAGTGFAIAMLAASQQIALDPAVAVTGDLTVDGTVQPVGAVVEKLQGAIEGKCKVTLIPERNTRDLVDFALLKGTPPLWETQVFTIATIDQAFGLARRDREPGLQNALSRFSALRARLPAIVTPNYLHSPIVQTELREVLRLAPNHLSAATLLRAAENQLPRELSLNRSVEEILLAVEPFFGEIAGPRTARGKETEEQNKRLPVFPEREFNDGLKTLQQLTPVLDQRSLEFKNNCVTFLGVLRVASRYQPPDLKTIKTQEQYREVVQREGELVKRVREDIAQAESRLLLAMRKLDADGSMMAELRRK